MWRHRQQGGGVVVMWPLSQHRQQLLAGLTGVDLETGESGVSPGPKTLPEDSARTTVGSQDPLTSTTIVME